MNGNGFYSHLSGITWAGNMLNHTVPVPGTQQIGNQSGANAPISVTNDSSGYIVKFKPGYDGLGDYNVWGIPIMRTSQQNMYRSDRQYY